MLRRQARGRRHSIDEFPDLRLVLERMLAQMRDVGRAAPALCIYGAPRRPLYFLEFFDVMGIHKCISIGLTEERGAGVRRGEGPLRVPLGARGGERRAAIGGLGGIAQSRAGIAKADRQGDRVTITYTRPWRSIALFLLSVPVFVFQCLFMGRRLP